MVDEMRDELALTPVVSGGIQVRFGDGEGAGLSLPMPFAQRIVLVPDTYVAGTRHVSGIAAIAGELPCGAELAFARDARNLVDPWAIQVTRQGRLVGFVPADQNEILARLMDGGKRVGGVVTVVERIGMWHRIGMEVYLDD